MLAVMIIPTGIGANIGGHSGDATSAASLMAACCDQLILHPNVVNASDFTEQPANSLYVEGAMLDSFLNKGTRLLPVRFNHVLVVCNSAERDTVNAVNALRSLIGLSAEIVELKTPLVMTGDVDVDKMQATGTIEGIDELVDQVSNYDYDALAIHTPVDVPVPVAAHYVNGSGGINPWGGVEAMLSKEVFWRTDKPTAHAPVEGREGYEYGVTDPRLAPEMVCAAHLGCVLRGLHKAPRSLGRYLASHPSIGSEDVDVMISPICWGEPHKTCREHGIPMIFVEENTTSQMAKFRDNISSDDGIIVDSYLEAAGAMIMMGMGRSLESVRRPLKSVKIHVK